MIRLCEPIFFFIISSQLGNSSSSDLIDIFRWTEQFGFLNIAYILLIMTSLFGNCALIHIIRTRPLMKTATNRLILNQACADLFTTLFVMTAMVRDTLFLKQWFGGTGSLTACRFTVWVTYIPPFCSVWTLTAIAVDRYFGVTYPLQASPISKHFRLVIAALWIWAVGSAAGMQTMVNLEFIGNKVYCVTDYLHIKFTAGNVTALCLLLSNFIVPLVVMTVFYGIVCLRLWSRDPPGEEANQDERHKEAIKTAKKVTQMMIIVVVLFVLCWFPFQFFVGLDTLHRITLPYPALKFVVWLSNAYSGINPFVYFCFNTNFRKELRVLVGKCFSRPKCCTNV